jgi:hypothetical protein
MRHPLTSLLAHHADFGSLPTREELDDLNLSSEHRDAALQIAQDAKRLHADGNRPAAGRHAIEHATGLVADLPDEQRDPRYLHRDPLADITNPDELAAHVRSASQNS